MKLSHYHYLLLLSFLLLAACYGIRPSKGGGETGPAAARATEPADITVPEGYEITAVTNGLNFPTAITFDDNGNAYVIESGYSYGEVFTTPRLLRLENGRAVPVAEGGKNGPWTGVSFYRGNFYVAEGGQTEGGKILRISRNGDIRVLVDSLPSLGDHHTNGPVIHNGHIYFGQGTATNSGVVGPDNAEFGWLKRHPQFHDLPCKDITLTGVNYPGANALDSVRGGPTSTGPYQPFNTPARPGQVVKGCLPCSGAIMRIPVDGGKLELVAWGLRNPYGLAVSPDDKLYATENAFDSRGSRPVWGAPDVLWEIKDGAWYGWPDYAGGQPVADNKAFKTPGEGTVKAVLQQSPGTVPAPVALLGVHSSSNGFDFSTSSRFGYQGHAFIAQFGDMAPSVGKVLFPVGFKVVKVDVKTGVTENFAVNKGKRNGPASWLGSRGLERPIDAQFDPSGENLYVVDFGVLRVTDNQSIPQPNTGVIWKISKKAVKQ